jgi:hypothetical protein
VDSLDSARNPASASADIVAESVGAASSGAERASSAGEVSDAGQGDIGGPAEEPTAHSAISHRVLRSQVATSTNKAHEYTHAHGGD